MRLIDVVRLCSIDPDGFAPARLIFRSMPIDRKYFSGERQPDYVLAVYGFQRLFPVVQRQGLTEYFPAVATVAEAKNALQRMTDEWNEEGEQSLKDERSRHDMHALRSFEDEVIPL